MTSCQCDSGGSTDIQCDGDEMAVCIEIAGRCLGKCVQVSEKLRKLIISGGDYPKEISDILTKESGKNVPIFSVR